MWAIMCSRARYLARVWYSLSDCIHVSSSPAFDQLYFTTRSSEAQIPLGVSSFPN
jgi:hypothetical protein